MSLSSKTDVKGTPVVENDVEGDAEDKNAEFGGIEGRRQLERKL